MRPARLSNRGVPCREVQREAQPLEVDGCWYLLRNHNAGEDGPASEDEIATAMVLSQAGACTFDMIRAAADSLIAWAESTVSQDSDTIIVVQPLNETATRRQTSIDTPPTLLSADASILKYLAEQQGIAKYQQDISVGSDLDRKTVGRRLRYLREHGYVKHPEARTRGHIITTLGLARLPKSSP